MNFEISGREPPADTGLPYGVRFGDFVGNGNSIVFNGANAGDCPNFSCQDMLGIAFLPLLLPLPSPARPVSLITLPLSILQRQWPLSTGTLGGLCSPSRPPVGSNTSTRGSEPMSTATRIRRRGECTRSSQRWRTSFPITRVPGSSRQTRCPRAQKSSTTMLLPRHRYGGMCRLHSLRPTAQRRTRLEASTRHSPSRWNLATARKQRKGAWSALADTSSSSVGPGSTRTRTLGTTR